MHAVQIRITSLALDAAAKMAQIQPSVLIFGSGAIGGWSGYFIHKGGCNVTAVCRSNYSERKKNGFRIESDQLGEVFYRPVVIKSVADARGHFDFVVIATKALAGQDPTVADIIKPAISTATAIVLVQNGIAIEAEYAWAFPGNTILSAVAYAPVTQISPGNLVHSGPDLREVGTYPANAGAFAKQQAQDFAKIFALGGGHIQIFDDIQERR